MTNWISVEDRLPVEDIWVLLYSDEEEEQIGWLNKHGKFTTISDDRFLFSNEITHWMPLPNPPKKI